MKEFTLLLSFYDHYQRGQNQNTESLVCADGCHVLINESTSLHASNIPDIDNNIRSHSIRHVSRI